MNTVWSDEFWIVQKIEHDHTTRLYVAHKHTNTSMWTVSATPDDDEELCRILQIQIIDHLIGKGEGL